MAFTKEQAMEKIRKCLALAAGTVPTEAESALLQAQKLMAKYHISMAEITDMEGDSKEEKVVRKEVANINLARPWVRELASTIARNFRCTNYLSGHGSTWRCVMMGYETDASVAVEVFSSCQKYVERQGENRAQRMNDKGMSSAGVKASFCVGFVEGLKKAYEAQVRKHEELSLMVVVPKEATDYIATLETRSLGFRQRARRDEHFDAGYQTGYDYGNQRSLEDGEE